MGPHGKVGVASKLQNQAVRLKQESQASSSSHRIEKNLIRGEQPIA